MSQVQVIIHGDVGVCAPYIAFGKSKLFCARQLGIPLVNDHYQFTDVTVTFELAYPYDKLYITQNPPEYLNCFLDTYPKLPPQTIGPDGDLLPYTTAQIGTQTVDELRYVIPPATVASPKMSFIRKKKTPSVKDLTTLLPVEPGAPIPDQTTNRFREAYERFLPSKFTGLMRGVIQILFSHYKITNTAQVKVDYRFGNSYGVIQNPATKMYYLLRITTDSVYYIPCGFSVSITGTTPNIQDVLLIHTVHNDKAVKIGTLPSGMGESWSDEIGWAFSYTDPVAEIVYTNNTFVGSQSYITAELLTLNFGFDSQTGLPNSSTLTRGGAEIMWNNHITSGDAGYGLFNVPVFGIPYPETGPARYYGQSIDFGQGTPVPIVRPMPYDGYVADGVPVYVYYTKSGRKLCTYSYRLFSDTSSTSPFNLRMYIDGGWSGTKTFGSYVQYGFSVDGSSVPTASGTDSSSYTEYQIVGAGQQDSNGGGTINNTPTIDATDHLGAHHLGLSTGLHAGSAKETDIEAVVYGKSGGGTSVDCSLTLSVTDRECAIVCTAISTAGSSISRSSTVAPCFIADNSDPISYTIAPGGANDYVMSNTGMPTSAAQFFLDSSFPSGIPWTIDAIHDVFGNLGSQGNITNESFLSSATTYIGFPRAGPYGTFYAQAPSTTITTGTPSTVSTQLYTATGVITLNSAIWNNNNLMFGVHPYPRLLDFKCAQAAFSPNDIAYQTAPGSSGAPLVKFEGGEYSVENRLFGFVGVV